MGLIDGVDGFCCGGVAIKPILNAPNPFELVDCDLPIRFGGEFAGAGDTVLDAGVEPVDPGGGGKLHPAPELDLLFAGAAAAGLEKGAAIGGGVSEMDAANPLPEPAFGGDSALAVVACPLPLPPAPSGGAGNVHPDGPPPNFCVAGAGDGEFRTGGGGGVIDAIALFCCACIVLNTPCVGCPSASSKLPPSRSVVTRLPLCGCAMGGGKASGRGDGGPNQVLPRLATVSSKLIVRWCSARDTRGDDSVDLKDDTDDGREDCELDRVFRLECPTIEGTLCCVGGDGAASMSLKSSKSSVAVNWLGMEEEDIEPKLLWEGLESTGDVMKSANSSSSSIVGCEGIANIDGV